MKLPQKFLIVPIFITICLDFVSLGVVIPILAPLILNSNTLIPSHIPLAERTILLGFLIASFPLASFFGSPILGAWSDRIGRKKVLIFSLIISFLSLILFGIGIIMSDISLLFLARIIGGFGGANINTCVAAMVDITPLEKRVKNFGLLGVASFAFGYVLGPIIGGFFSNPHILPWFNNSTPFFIVAGWTLMNLILVILFFPETLKTRSQGKIELFSGVINIFRVFKLKHFRSIFLMIFLITFGFNFFDQFFQVFLIQKFNFNQTQIAFMFALLGIFMALTQGLIIRIIPKNIKPERVLMVCLPTLAILFPLLLLYQNPLALYALVPVIAIFQGLAWPFSTSLVTNLADEVSVGKILGINSSLQGLAIGLPPLLAGYFSSLNINLPILAAGLTAFLAWIIFLTFYLGEKHMSIEQTLE